MPNLHTADWYQVVCAVPARQILFLRCHRSLISISLKSFLKMADIFAQIPRCY